MGETDTETSLAAAHSMIDIFVSVGAGHFHVTWTNGEAQPRRARSLRQSLAALGNPLPHADNPDWLDAIHIARITAADLDRAMPALLETAFADRLNLNVRPYAKAVWFIQLDDIPPDALLRASAAMFLHIETSPGKHQAWLALPGTHDRQLARRVRRAAGSDPTASGATKIAGSLNIKTRYAPNYPRVAIRAAHSGRTTTIDDLERLGLVAPAEQFAPVSPPRTSTPTFSGTTDKWPSYAMSLDKAPRNRDGSGPDRSRADYWWCFLAIQWGHDIIATADRLIEESPKAREKGRSYAVQTARQAAAAVERRRQ
jgi:RepB DNA-primase from phage plasmid